jgi:Fe-S cluster biogenesis protein NfuA
MSIELSHQEMVNRIETALENIRPFLIKDGGNVELVDIVEGEIVRVKLLGACRSCDISHMTLKAGIEDSIRTALPGIKEVVSVD